LSLAANSHGLIPAPQLGSLVALNGVRQKGRVGLVILINAHRWVRRFLASDSTGWRITPARDARPITPPKPPSTF
jgi:hypothetical protein